MAVRPTIHAEQFNQGPTLVGVMLPGFNSTDLESVRCGFHAAPPCHLRQTWQAKESERFAPAVVRAGGRHNSILVYAELTDVDTFTQASGLNQRTWERRRRV